MTTQFAFPDAYDIEDGRALEIGPARLVIDHDPMSDNPWGDLDGLTPLAAYSLGHGSWEHVGTWDRGDSADLENPFYGAPWAWVSRHWRALCDALDVDQAAHDQEARDLAAWDGIPLGEARADCLGEALGDLETSDRLEAAAAVWRMRGVNALAFQKNGYSQGDSVLGLLVQTPDFLERVGLGNPDTRPADDIAADLEGDARLFASWAFGDIYGFTWENEEGDALDSCFGFYGVPWGNNPGGRSWAVLEAAQEALEAVAAQQVQEARKSAQEARQAFLEARAEWKAARAGAQGKTPALCAALARYLGDLAQAWKEARARARSWAALEALGQEVAQ